MGLDGRVVVISGVGPGLGRALAHACCDAGGSVVLAARDARRLDDVAGELGSKGGRMLAVPTDITDAAQRQRLVATTLDQLGRLDGLVNNAFTMGPMAKAVDLGPDDWRAAYEVNVVATVALSVAAGAWMADHGGGSIVMVNSQAARRGAPRRGPYAASKAALLSAAQVLASELGPRQVRVNSVVPGQIWADSLAEHYANIAARRGVEVDEVLREVTSGMALRRISTPEEIAAAVVFLLSDQASAITGQALDVNAGNWFH